MDCIGVLALQGDVAAHVHVLECLGKRSRLVRRPADLEACDGLILPGGESTTLTLLLEQTGLAPAIRSCASTLPLFGTCAGLILMAQSVADPRVRPLGSLDIEVNRNHYGRQTRSFVAEIDCTGVGRLRAVFIRAPAVVGTKTGVQVLARHNSLPVAVQQGRHIGCCFHPELTGDPRLYAYWLGLTAE